MGMRVLLLLSIVWIVRLTAPLFYILERPISGRDLILIGGGLFLLAKATIEIHDRLEGEEGHKSYRVRPSFAAVILQIVLLDIVFSLDSVITAIGMADQIAIMVTAVILAVGVMMFSAGPISAFVNRHPTVKVLAADRCLPDSRGLRHAHSEGLYLLCHGLLRVCGNDQPARQKKRCACSPA
jgi:predicted tellurium resistance membrane protein TerC